MSERRLLFGGGDAKAASDVPQELQGRWSVVAARLGPEVLTGEILDVWVISARAFENSSGSFGVQAVCEVGQGQQRLWLLSMGSTGMQYALHASEARKAPILAIAYLWGEEKMRCLIVPEAPDVVGSDTWSAELKSAESLFPHGALEHRAVTTIEGQKDLLLFEPPDDE